MSDKLTDGAIKQLCGQASYSKGAAYYRAGKVSLTSMNPDKRTYKAVVKANGRFEVSIVFDPSGNANAECSCSVFFTYDKHCKHVAAVLLHIRDMQRDNRSPDQADTGNRRYAEQDAQGDTGLASRMLGLFNNERTSAIRSDHRSRFDSRSILNVTFICRTMPYGGGKHMFGLAIKIGLERLYIVQHIRDFLACVERREPHIFSKQFRYDPALHSFSKEDYAVIRLLIEICRNEQLYLEGSVRHAASKSSSNDERTLLIPSFSWDNLLGLLGAAFSVQLQQGELIVQGLALSQEPVPLQFRLGQAEAVPYQLDIEGLDNIMIMEAYGIIVSAGRLVKLPVEQCKLLAELQLMLDASGERQIPIAAGQLEPFIEKVIPGLQKIGSISIAPAIASRIVSPQLKAKLYLDRVKDRLLAGLEFQYGDIIINPLERAVQRGEERILMRDTDEEEQILELMELGDFLRTESGYMMNDEDSEYEFLYHIMPQLEKRVEVYATSAVKARLHAGPVFPKVKVDVDERTHWLEFEFDIEDIPEQDIRKLLASLEQKRRYYRLPGGALMPLETVEFQKLISFMNKVGLHRWDMHRAQFRIPAAAGLHLIDSGDNGSAVKLGKSLRKLLDNMRNPDHLDFPVPESLTSVLRDYQGYGYQWMRTIARYGFGGILADDMGLGKTVQSITFLLSSLPEIRSQGLPAIVVSPASLLYNWRNELNKFAPELRVAIADGSAAGRRKMLNNTSETDIIITSYPLLRKDAALYAGQSFHTLILDEAQAIKNYATQTAQSVKSLQAKHRFALTGTPVENRLEELWSIFDAIFPELFGSRSAFHELTREEVAKRVRPFLLRRLKIDVLKELPEKIESVQATRLLPEQKKLYVAYLAKLRHETVKHLDKDTFEKNRIKIFAGLTRLRQLCCHPALFVEGYAGSSSKFEQLLEIVDECRSAGKRMLIFSQFTEMLGLIGRELGYQGIPYFYLDGQTAAAERVELCSRFNEGERELFLISLKAGGTGLNLTGADTVVLYDLWWNPAVEQQAADRAHRMGQKNVVQVIRLVTHGTIEDKMYELQKKKKSLIDEVIQPGEEALSALTEEDIREILMI